MTDKFFFWRGEGLYASEDKQSCRTEPEPVLRVGNWNNRFHTEPAKQQQPGGE